MLPAFVKAAEAAPSPVLPSLPDLVWGTIVFVILLVFFIWYVMPRLNKLLDDRRDAIDGGIQRAEKAQAEAGAALDKYNAQLAQARSDAGHIREQARAEGAQIIAEAKEQAVVEAARITATAHAQIESERAAAEASLKAEVGNLSLDLASRVVGEHLSDDQNASALVDKFLADLEADELSKSKAGE
jgi:F-type H+-transporting ATPase subunit b